MNIRVNTTIVDLNEDIASKSDDFPNDNILDEDIVIGRPKASS